MLKNSLSLYPQDSERNHVKIFIAFVFLESSERNHVKIFIAFVFLESRDRNHVKIFIVFLSTRPRAISQPNSLLLQACPWLPGFLQRPR